METHYLGRISKIIDRVTYEIRVTVDGIVEDKPAFPLRGEVSEPKVGDYVLLKNIDPMYGSMYLYSKLKEDQFIGFRSNGKALEITPEYMELTVYDRGGLQDAHDGFEDVGQCPWFTRVRMDKNGDVDVQIGKGKPGTLTIHTYKDTKVQTDRIKVDNAKVKNTLSSDTLVTIEAPVVSIKTAALKVDGVVTATAFNVVPPTPTP